MQMPVWKQFIKLRTNSPLLFRSIILLFAIEAFAILLAPLFISPTTYINLYLSDRAKQTTQDFFLNSRFLIPDDKTGWRSKPNTKIKNWEIDSFGSRSSHPVNIHSSKPIRTIFMGSSMINGGTDINNQETLSAYLANEQIEALNFGTMLYSSDQSYELLKEVLHLKPNVVIIGLDSDPVTGLSNIYVPFRNRNEVNVAFLKPRYRLQNNKLVKIEINPKDLNRIFEDESVISFLQENDGYYHRFKRFTRFSHTPLASLVGVALRKQESFSIYQNSQPENEKILLLLAQKFMALSQEHGFKLLFLSTPSYANLKPNRVMRYFPNQYKNRVKQLEALGLPIVDAAEIFKQYDGNLSDLFHVDRVHFSATANHLIAQHLRGIILN